MKLIDKLKKSFADKKEKKEKNKAREKYHKEVLSEEKKRKTEAKDIPASYISLRHINKIYDNHIQAETRGT